MTVTSPTSFFTYLLSKMWLLIVEIALLTDMAKQTVIYVKCCADWFVCLGVFLFIAFV